MGLDSNLDGELYLSEYSNEEKKVAETIRKALPHIGHSPKKIVYEIGYWRKANHIHKWFVDNIQDGKDDCGRYWVSKDMLKELQTACRAAIAGDPEELPTVSGFFFGDTSRGEYYINMCENTLTFIDQAFKFIDQGGSIYYSSSW